MKLIPLTKGLFAQVDDEDFEELSKYSWYASGPASGQYAARRMKQNEDPTRPLIYMHQQLADRIGHTDHIDRNKLNNQKHNLRKVTHSENQLNSDRVENQKGIGRDMTYKTWKAHYNQPGKKRVNIGTYKTYNEAVTARKKWMETNT